MQEFVYERPETIADALAALGRGGARALAGGTDLIPQLREGRRSAERLVDLKFVPELTAITAVPGGGVAVGAAATASAIAAHPLLAAYPAVAESVRLIGSLQVQNRCSLGGNICNAAPSADAVPAVICHGARAVVAGAGGARRELAVEEVFQGPGRTNLQTGELLMAIHLPPPPKRSAAKYLRFTPRREMDIAVAGSGVLIALGEDDRISEAHIVLASVGPTPLRAPGAERRLIGQKPTAALIAEAGRLAAADARPISDTRGSADYRRTLVSVLTARALEDCCRRLGVQVGSA